MNATLRQILVFGLAFAVPYLVTRFFPGRSPVGRMSEAEAVQAAAPVVAAVPEVTASRVTWVQSLASASVSELAAFYHAAEDDPERQNLVAHYWARTAPAQFLDFLTRPDSPYFSNPSHARHLFDEWGRRDFDVAFEAALELSPFNLLRENILRRTIAALLPFDPEKAIGHLDAVYANAGSPGAIDFEGKSPQDLQRYLEAFSQLPQVNVTRMAIDECWRQWMKHDLDSAIVWAQSRGVGEGRSYISAIAYELINTDPEKAADLYASFPEPAIRGTGGRSLTKRLASLGHHDVAAEWINSNLRGYARSQAALDAAGKIAQNGDVAPAVGAEFALKIENKRARNDALREALKHFSSRDPIGARKWAYGQSDPDIRAVAVAYLEGQVAQ